MKNQCELNYIKELEIQDDKIMLPFDVTSLYRDVPIKEKIYLLKKWVDSINLLIEDK